MTRQEMIEKLKDPERAQPFCLLSSEEQAILKEGGASCLYLSWRDNAAKWNPMHFVRIEGNKNVYILGPGYQPKPKPEPEPEYVDIEIIVDGDGQFKLSEHWDGLKHDYDYLWWVVGHKDFVKFFASPPTEDGRVPLADIATLIREGNKVFAKFVKE